MPLSLEQLEGKQQVRLIPLGSVPALGEVFARLGYTASFGTLVAIAVAQVREAAPVATAADTMTAYARVSEAKLKTVLHYDAVIAAVGPDDQQASVNGALILDDSKENRVSMVDLILAAQAKGWIGKAVETCTMHVPLFSAHLKITEQSLSGLAEATDCPQLSLKEYKLIKRSALLVSTFVPKFNETQSWHGQRSSACSFLSLVEVVSRGIPAEAKSAVALVETLRVNGAVSAQASPPTVPGASDWFSLYSLAADYEVKLPPKIFAMSTFTKSTYADLRAARVTKLIKRMFAIDYDVIAPEDATVAMASLDLL